ncbi:hypothetical protein [Oryza sativa Japonica Group]|uniref:Uncharacterized protein n=1 Tax=Oryza sativa subsp. japonica TaxID=39947 RepID=Q5ZB83_ORYSJ|nr:hypothetical protein [Oryza sativa Japonica Group]
MASRRAIGLRPEMLMLPRPHRPSMMTNHMARVRGIREAGSGHGFAVAVVTLSRHRCHLPSPTHASPRRRHRLPASPPAVVV